MQRLWDTAMTIREHLKLGDDPAKNAIKALGTSHLGKELESIAKPALDILKIDDSNPEYRYSIGHAWGIDLPGEEFELPYLGSMISDRTLTELDYTLLTKNPELYVLREHMLWKARVDTKPKKK